MPCKVLAAVGLSVLLVIIVGCASPTPTPEPTAAPSPTATATSAPTPQSTATPSEYAAGLAYASEERLEGGDAEIYADSFADAKALGLGDADARDYANALVYLNAITSLNNWPTHAAEEVIAAFIAAYDEAVKVNGASGREALSRAYATQRGNEASAAAFASAFAQTDASGVAAHVYANEYVPPGYAPEGGAGVADEFADRLAGALARGYATSSASNVQERLNYAAEYYDGYAGAAFRAAHEQGYTNESRMRVLAEVIAAWPEEQAHIYASSYADARLAGRSDAEAGIYAAAYEEAYISQVNDGAEEDEARRRAAAFASAALGS